MDLDSGEDSPTRMDENTPTHPGPSDEEEEEEGGEDKAAALSGRAGAGAAPRASAGGAPRARSKTHSEASADRPPRRRSISRRSLQRRPKVRPKRSRSRSIPRNVMPSRFGKGKGKERREGGALCFPFIMDKCRKGDSCRERHPDQHEVEGLRRHMARTNCRYGLQCMRPDCMFKHPPGRKLSAD
uniref:C3H1-type domain-containing protein n=1 Tax=Pyrodinium bahamense TaxID=73915 RepID=A0A7S0AVS7_9DINO